VLLSFFATWCTFCSAEVDTLNKIHKQYRGKPLKILAVDMQESPSLVQQYISRKGITYLVFLDRDMSAARILNVLGVPTNLIIDRDGIVRYHSNPLPDNYREIIDPLLQGLDKRAPGA
jgi:thiol-disulfide isomerase/thioredoxin